MNAFIGNYNFNFNAQMFNTIEFVPNFNFSYLPQLNFQFPNNSWKFEPIFDFSKFIYSPTFQTPSKPFAFNSMPTIPTMSFVQEPIATYTKPKMTQSVFATTTPTSTNSNNSPKKSNETKNDFDKMLSFVLKAEGGYVANDCGQATNKGIQQRTYDSYRAEKGLPKQPVKNITDAEVRAIYYEKYYVASGADKIEDPELALYVFDTAVNMGVGAAKKLLAKSGDDANRFSDLRLERYQSIVANNSSKAKYLKGWTNRVTNVENFAAREFVA